MATDVTPPTEGSQIQPHWELAKALWLQGLKAPQIAEQCHVTVGALKMRASRYRWNELRNQAITVHLTQQKVLTKESTTRTKLHQKLQTLTESLPDKPVSAKQLPKIAGAAKDITDALSKVEGWADATTSKIDVQVLSQGAEQILPDAMHALCSSGEQQSHAQLVDGQAPVPTEGA